MTSEGNFLCHDCGEKFTRKFNLARHIERFHLKTETQTNRKKIGKGMVCAFCESNHRTILYLERHLQIEHGIELKFINYTFSSFEEFQLWKEKEENASISLYVKSKLHIKKNGEQIIYYECNRSGVYRRKGKGQRMERFKGTCKTGYHCPARLSVIIQNSGEVKVKYQSIHVGHEHQFCYLRLSSSQEKLIASKLKQGIKLDQILEEIRNEITASSVLEKKHFLTKKNLFNLMKKYSISNPKKNYGKSKANTEKLLKECQQMRHNPILLYKKPHESHPQLRTNETMIIIMNDVQAEMLKKFAQQKIVIDSINSESYYQLTVMLVIDEYGEEFPCSFCISDRIDETTLSLFFQTIKKVTGPLCTECLVSEANPSYVVAWEKNMTKVSTRLINKWYVDEDWKNNLKLVNDKKIKDEIYSRLRLLLEESDLNEFSQSLILILQTLKEKCRDFCNYFTTNYYYKCEEWASCYRSKEFLKHDKMLDTFHRSLKIIHTKGMKQRSIDTLLHSIFKIIREKVFNRLMCMEDCTGTSYNEKSYKRHRYRKEVKNISETAPNQWRVKSDREENASFIIKMETESCECKRKCHACGICVHMYSCTCNDYLIMHNLCKHIHALIMPYVEDTTANCQNSVTIIENDILVEDCQVLEIGNWMTKEGKNALIDKLNRCITLLKETESESMTIEMEEQINKNVDNVLTILYGNSEVTVESLF